MFKNQLNTRYKPEQSGEIGELAIVRIAHMTPGHMPQEGHGPEGPCFHDCGMHYVDVARWYAGSDYDTYHAQGVRMWSYDDPWWIQAHGTFKNGVVFDVTQGFVYGHMAEKQTHNCYVDVIGTKGIARMTHDFKTATVEMHGVTQTIVKTDVFKDKKVDIMIDVFARSILAGRNLGYPTVEDSVIASDMAWKMFDDAVKNGAPFIGSPDNTEEFEFANGVNTNCDVYNNLIHLCNNEISMLVSGAIIGQDTRNGNESKEKISISLLDRLVDADKRMAEMYMNSIVIPSWIRIGWIPATTSRFRFKAVENTYKRIQQTNTIRIKFKYPPAKLFCIPVFNVIVH